MSLKAEMKYGQEYVTADLLLDDPREEMNQLIDDDPERYQASSDDSDCEGLLQTPNYSDDNSEQQSFIHRRMLRAFDESSEQSLMSEREARGRQMERKAREAKVNNSFTGPYPLDPTDFNHLDKGANAQFSGAQPTNAGK